MVLRFKKEITQGERELEKMAKPPKQIERNKNFFQDVESLIDNRVTGADKALDSERSYLLKPAPNVVEWVTGLDYWNVPSTFRFWRQYQILRDMFNLRCPFCNSQEPDAIDCWNKSRAYLESENLFVWNSRVDDFECPSCKNSMQGLIKDNIITPYNELICIAGMRSGKSYLGAHIGGYIEHCLRVKSTEGRFALQRYLRQEKSEWFEVTFAASTAEQAKNTIYAKYRGMRDNSPWINRHVRWVKKQEKKQLGSLDPWEYKVLEDSVIDGWLQVRFNRISSNSGGVAGRTRILGAIDELARLAQTEAKTSAMELYRVINQSLKTVRSAVDNYSLFPFLGLMLNVTSPISIDDIAMQIYNKAEKQELKRTYYWKGPTWEFNPEQKRENFDEEYIKDPVAAQRDFGADPPAAQSPLFDQPLRFWSCIHHEREPVALFHETHLTDKTGKQYVGLNLDSVDYNFTDQHYLFIDAGLTFDSFAVVCGHPALKEEGDFEVEHKGIKPRPPGPFGDGRRLLSSLPSAADSPRAQGRSMIGGNPFYPDPQALDRLITVVDFCVRIVPTKTREIYFNSILDIIKGLQQKIHIAGVWFDAWNSAHIIQNIRSLGIPATRYSIRMEDFMSFRTQVYNDQVNLLPPALSDGFSLSPQGTIQMTRNEEEMSGEGVTLLETLRLERSEDLRKIIPPNKKGQVRGRGSDDLARCLVGLNRVIKASVVNEPQGRKAQILQRQIAYGGYVGGSVLNKK